MERYRLKQLSDDLTDDLLTKCLLELSDIDVDDLTTFELSFLRRFAENPPSKRRGAEDSINERT